MKKKNKKVKLKNKKIVIPILVGLLLVIGVVIFIFFYLNEKNAEKLIKNNYNKYVITTGNVKLYDSNKKNIGLIYKGYKLELDEIKNLSIKNKYFKIKNTDNYISYKNIKKTDKFENSTNIGNYVTFNKNIKTSKKVYLYNGNDKVLSLDGINLPILYKDKDNYYVSFLNNIFSIRKDKSIKEIDHENTKDKASEYVSVLYYEAITNNCEVANCFDTTDLRLHVDKLKESGYYFISKDDYLKYLNGYLRLKEKAVLILTGSETEEVKKANNELGINIGVISDKDGIKFEDTNKRSTPSDDKNKANRYSIKYYSTIDNIVKMANGEEVHEEEPPKNPNQGIAVLNYHFFYDPATQECNETICLKVDMFRSHLQYLKDNGYKTLTMKEFVNWIYGRIELPEKSVLITVDDGAMGTGRHNGNHLATILNEYKMHATLFLITGWWDIENYRSPYLDIQSHTHDLHYEASCGHRSKVNCVSYDALLEDLRKSIDVVKDTNSFCFPFYDYTESSINAVKEAGFKIAFVGGRRKATRDDNKYKIPRYPIYDTTSMNSFIDMIS